MSLGIDASHLKRQSIPLGTLSCRLQSLEIFDSPAPTASPHSHLSLVTVVVHDYDLAINFFTKVLGFTLVEDSPSKTNDGREKRWVVVRPSGGGAGLLLAQADSDEQRAVIGKQTGGRVGFFLRTEEFDVLLNRIRASGAAILSPPRNESYGRVVVFEDLLGNKWDLLGPPIP